jgi:hypothetical protein
MMLTREVLVIVPVPQNLVNQRPTIALFSSDMTVSFREVTNRSAVIHPVDAATSENVRWNSF